MPEPGEMMHPDGSDDTRNRLKSDPEALKLLFTRAGMRLKRHYDREEGGELIIELAEDNGILESD